ncbi:MAG TPA: potassium channel family protein [Candidatus Woesebacteria bacterium]|nr:potassium channel family protein [Candidatus Woesebacteria bacterium]
MRNILAQLLRQRTLRKILTALLFLSFSIAILIVPLESGQPKATINNFGDAIWWMVSTITSVGYGDVVPVTFEGRVLGIVLQVIGVVMTSSIIGSLVIQLHRKRDNYQWERMDKKLDQIIEDLDVTKRKTDFIILQTGEHKINNKKK